MKGWALAHKLTDEACRIYRSTGQALVSFAGPAWRDIRPMGRGRFSGVQMQGTVDYIGHDRHGQGFRFDLKTSKQKTQLDLRPSKVPQHQVEELAWCLKLGVPAGLLICRQDPMTGTVAAWYWLPIAYLHERFDGFGSWKALSWKEIDELSLRLQTLDTTGRVPDFLDRILE